jgi:predicted ATPase
VASAVAAALDVQEVPGHPLVETIALRLQSRGTLLLLDNCEHVVAEAARVVERLVRVASLRVLATSREPLRVAGERIYRLLPLGEVPAIELFEDRARAVKHDFALGAETLPLVARICERLGNLPLAIELAAARVTALSVASIAEMLEHRFALLAGGSRTSSGRQQTMRGTIAWSYELLAQPERRVFERLSVFAGGCTLECAVAVCAGEDCARADVFDLISSLVDKSLVIADLEDSSPRYGMLEPFREYAREQLAARGELDPTQRRHALVWLEFAMQLGYHSTAATRSWHSLARAEHENLRVALEWTLVGGKDAPLGGRIVAAFTPFWLDLAAIEGLRWVQLALAGVDPQSEVEVAARLERTLARLSLSLGDLPAALEAARRAEERFRTLGDRLETGRAQGDAAAALVLLGRPAEAEPLVLLALEASRETGHALTMAKLWLLLAEARAMLCDFAGSRAAWSEAMSHAAFGAARNRGPALVTGAEIEFRAGEVGAAIRLCSEALACCGDDAGNAEIATTARANLAAYHVAAGRLEEARGFARAALLGARETGLALQVLWSVQHLGAISVLRSCGGAATQEHLATGARLLGFVDAGYEALGALRHTTEQQERDHVIAVLGATLAREDCEAQLARGAMLGEDQAIALALEV